MTISNLWEFDAATASNNSDIGGNNIAENNLPGTLNNALRELCMYARRICNQGSDIASASTCNIAATGTSFYVKVTGTTGITSFGTANAGVWRWVTFTGALTITHNATSMILDGGANFTTSAGDMIFAVSEGSGNWRVRIFPASGKPVVSGTVGKHKLWIPAAAMRPQTANGPASADVSATNIQYFVLDFDQTSGEAAHFNISMPSSWNEGTITFIPVWTAASGSGDVVWLLEAVARSEGDAIDYTYTTSATSIDTLTTAGDLHRGPESSAFTIEGSPAANDTVFFLINRNASNGSDTLNADARLLGIELYITTDAAVDVS